MKNIAYLISAAATNFGDDLIALLWVKNLRSERPDLRIIIDCVDPSTFALLLAKQNLTQNISAINLFWRACGHYSAELNEAFPAIERDLVLNTSTDFRTAHTFFSNVAFAQFLGGGYINDNWTRNALLTAIFAFFKKQYKFPLFWTGASIVPSAPASKLSFAKHLSIFDFITTRDTKSTELISPWNNKTSKTCDDAFLAFQDISPVQSENRKILFLNIQRDCRSAEFYEKNLHDIMQIAQNWDGEIVYLDGYPLCDRNAVQYIETKSKKFSVISEHELILKLFSGEFDIGKNSQAIVSRFHLHLLLALLGVPGQFITPDDSYYSNKHNSLVELGSKWKRFQSKLETLPCPSTTFAITNAAQKQTELRRILNIINEINPPKPISTDAQTIPSTKSADCIKIAQLVELSVQQESNLNAQKIQNESLNSDIQRLQNELKDSIAKISTLSTENRDLLSKLETATSEISKIQISLSAQIETLKLEKDKIFSELQTAQQSSETSAKEHREALDKLRETHKELVANLENKNHEISADLQKKNEELKNLSNIIEKLHAENAALHNKNATLHARNADINFAKTKVEAELAQLETERNLLMLSFTAAQDRIQNYHRMSKDPYISTYRKIRRTLGIWKY